MPSRRDITAGRAFVELYVKKNRFMRGLQQARQALQKFGQNMMATGRQVAIASALMLAPLVMGVKTFAAFDDAMRQVKAVTGATVPQFQKLTLSAKELGRTTSFTAIEVANLMTELGRAGFSTDEIDAMTGSVLNLARATGTEATNAAGIMSASLRQFGLGAKDATRIADSLTTAANSSFTTVDQLGEALAMVGPVADDFNLSFEDTLALLGSLGNIGIQGSAAGTSMRRIMLAMGADAKKLEGIFGVSLRNAAGDAIAPVEALDRIGKSLEGLGTSARSAKLNEAFGLRGITGASAISGTIGNVEELADKIKEGGGNAAKAAEEMDAGLGGALRIMRSAAEGALIALGEAVEKGLQPMIETGTKLLGVVTKFVENNKELVTGFAKFAVVVGVVGASMMAIGLGAQVAAFAIGGLMAIITGVATVIGGLMTVVATLWGLFSSPIALIVVGLVGIVAAILQATGALEAMAGWGVNIGAQFGKVFGDIKETVGTTFAGIADAMMAGDMALAGEIAMTGLKLAVQQGIEGVSQIVGGVWGDTIAKLLSSITSGDFAGAWETVVLGMEDIWNTVVLTMSQIWQAFSKGITDVMVGAARGVLAVWKGIVDKITQWLLLINKEYKRSQELNAKMAAAGMTPGRSGVGGGGDIFDQIENGTFSGSGTQGISDGINSGLDVFTDAAAARKTAADQAAGNAMSTPSAFSQNVGGASDKSSDEVLRLEKQLAKQRSDAALKKFLTKLDLGDVFGMFGGGTAGGAAGGTGGTGAGTAGAAGGGSVASNSAGLLALQLGAGGASDPVAAAVKESEEMTVTAIEGMQAVLDVSIIGIGTRIVQAMKENKLDTP